MLTELVADYETLCMHITDIVDKSGYKMDYVREKLGYSRVGWYKKRKSGNFAPKELKQLFKIIRIEEIEDQVFGELLKKPRPSDYLNLKTSEAFVDSV